MSCSFKYIIQNAYDAIVHQVVGMEGNIPMFQGCVHFFERWNESEHHFMILVGHFEPIFSSLSCL